MRNKFLKWLIYGKDYSLENTEWNLFLAERASRFFLGLFLLMFLGCISLIILVFVISESDCMLEFSKKQEYPINSSTFDNVVIKYRNLSNSEIKHFESIFYDLNPLYLAKNNYFEVIKGELEGFEDAYGLNYDDGEQITIKYLQSDYALKTILCHELLHTYFRNDNEEGTPEHEIIYKLGESHICFNK